MKHLGTIQIGGSLDITNNRHVEDLVEEALEGLVIPEDTNTTYTLTQDGLTVQLVDDNGGVASEIEIPKFEDTNTTYTLVQDGTYIRLADDGGGASEIDLAPLIPQPVDPYQEEKSIPLPPVNLYDMLRSRERNNQNYDLASEYDAENNRISIYLHLDVNGVKRTFTLADNVSNQLTYYGRDGSVKGSIDLVDIVSERGTVFMIGSNTDNLNTPHGSGIPLPYAFIFPADNAEQSNHSDGVVLQDEFGGSYGSFVFTDVDEETVSDHEVITATLEEHLQNLYEHTHAL